MQKKRKTAVLLLLLAVFFTGCKKEEVLFQAGQETEELAEEQNTAFEEEEPEEIYVYVCGEVENPGVYALAREARVVDAVHAAGGMTETAEEEFLNLAEPLSDGQKIQVPDQEQAEVMKQKTEADQSGLVNLNTADAAALTTLPGVGESKANAIIQYRESNGGFQRIEDIMKIPGIKEGLFQKIKEQIAV